MDLSRLVSKKLVALIAALGVILFMQHTGATREDIEWAANLTTYYLLGQGALDAYKETLDGVAKIRRAGRGDA